jgi:hypothetical protein
MGLDYSSFANTNLTEVILPDNVKYLENAAFAYNKYLKRIDFGSVKHIGDWQCLGCIHLEEVIVPDNTYIDINCFSNCFKLKKIVYKGTMESWKLT